MKRSGFTLVELIVALSIFAFLLGNIFFFLGTQVKFWNKTEALVKKQQISHIILAQIIRDLRSAATISPLSSKEKLQLMIGPDLIEYSLANQKIKRRKNNYSRYLTTEEEIKTFYFAYPASREVEINIEDFSVKTFSRN